MGFLRRMFGGKKRYRKRYARAPNGQRYRVYSKREVDRYYSSPKRRKSKNGLDIDLIGYDN